MADRFGTACLKAPAKLNLSLKVLGRRPDGYHELFSLVGFADLHDHLTVISAEDGEDSLSIDGPFGDRLVGDNLVLQAVRAFRREVCDVPPLRINLVKSIPVAAGLGGGSADAAAILRHLALWAGLAPEAAQIRRIAAELGADIPVCLQSRLRHMRGTGTELEDTFPDMAPIGLLLVNPRVAVPTGPVFTALGARPLDQARTERPAPCEDEIFAGTNDLEGPARKVAPVIGDVLSALKDTDRARGARLSGSGATCFALFDDLEARDNAARVIAVRNPNWWLHKGLLMNWSVLALGG